MNKEYKVIHTCKGCGAKFEVDQGSRRNFCVKCVGERQVAGTKPKGG